MVNSTITNTESNETEVEPDSSKQPTHSASLVCDNRSSPKDPLKAHVATHLEGTELYYFILYIKYL